MEESELDPDALVNEYNTELAQQREELQETIVKLEENLERGKEADEIVEELHRGYRDLSRKRTNFMAENEEFEPTKPDKPLQQPTLKDHRGSRGLAAMESELLEHKEELDQQKHSTLQQAESAYRRYRREKGLEPVEPVMRIPSELQELEGLKKAREDRIFDMRDYLKDLRKIDSGEKDAEESSYAVPESEELIQDQIDRASERIYESWEKIKSKQERVENALDQLKQEKDERPAIDIAIRYGIRPLDITVENTETNLRELSSYCDQLGETIKVDLPDRYSEKVDQRMTANT